MPFSITDLQLMNIYYICLLQCLYAEVDDMIKTLNDLFHFLGHCCTLDIYQIWRPNFHFVGQCPSCWLQDCCLIVHLESLVAYFLFVQAWLVRYVLLCTSLLQLGEECTKACFAFAEQGNHRYQTLPAVCNSPCGADNGLDRSTHAIKRMPLSWACRCPIRNA